MPLTMVLPGKEVTFFSFNGGRGMRTKLYNMGLIPGTKFRVLNNRAIGPLLVAVRGYKVALGYGMAAKILVQEH